MGRRDVSLRGSVSGNLSPGEIILQLVHKFNRAHQIFCLLQWLNGSWLCVQFKQTGHWSKNEYFGQTIHAKIKIKIPQSVVVVFTKENSTTSLISVSNQDIQQK